MESKYIVDIFKDYLATEKTNYALLINGSWGSGKTYFWKTTLTDICKNASFKPIYLSLNGINKIETLDYQLKIKFIPFLNKLDIKKSASIGNLSKNLVSAVIKGKWNVDVEKIFNDVEIDLALFSNNVVCFDDLERCKIPLPEVLGYVNDYVEHKNLKVVFLSHEKENNDDDYNSIKEKVIGRILNFKNNLIDTLPFLFDKYKTDEEGFYNFLLSKKGYVYDLLVEYKEENLRNIAFYIDTLYKIYPITKLHNDYSNEILLFTLIFTIEFKTGKLTSNDYQDFKGYEDLNSPFALYNFSKPKEKNLYQNEENKVEPKTDLEIFYEKYLRNNIAKYFFYPSIYQFILTGYLDKKLLTNELKARYPEEISIETISFRKLLNFKFRNLSNDEFEKLSKEVFEYANEGKYGIYDYLQLSNFYNYFSENKLINLSLKDIQQSLKKGIEISKKRKDSSKQLFDNIFHFENKEYDPIITKLIKEAHELIEREKESIKINKLIDALKENNIEKIIDIFKEYSVQKELFEQLDANGIFETLLTADNNTISTFILQLEGRYNFGNVKDYLSNDYNLLSDLLSKIDETLKDKTKLNLNEFLLNELSSKIKEICKKLE
jgi:hypothetical protein